MTFILRGSMTSHDENRIRYYSGQLKVTFLLPLGEMSV